MEYVANPNAPTYRAHRVHDLDFVGTDGLFTLVQFKKTSGGVWYQETAFYVELPVAAIGPGVALTTRKMGTSIIGPIVGAAARALSVH